MSRARGFGPTAATGAEGLRARSRAALAVLLLIPASLALAAVSVPAPAQEPGAAPGQPPGAPGAYDPADPSPRPDTGEKDPGREAADALRRGAQAPDAPSGIEPGVAGRDSVGASDRPGGEPAGPAGIPAGADSATGRGRPVFGADSATAGGGGEEAATGDEAPRAGGGAPGAERVDAAGAAEAGRGRGTTGAPRPAPMAVPPKPPVHQYRVGAGASAFAWDADARAEDGALLALEVERDLASFLAARAAVAYGATEITAGGGGEEPQRVDTRLYLPELSLLLQPPLGRAAGSAFVPYALVGFGSLISDPKRDGFNTRSQNAFAYGAGARLGFGERLGLQGEVRRYLIKLEDTFIPESTDSESIHNTRFGGSLTYSF